MVICARIPKAVCKLAAKAKPVKNHFVSNKSLYKGAGTLAISIIAAQLICPGGAFASIDAGGQKLYSKIVPIGKWVIVIKGCIDTIQAILSGDFGAAKKSFLGYLLCFAVILGLPWSLDQVNEIFKN